MFDRRGLGSSLMTAHLNHCQNGLSSVLPSMYLFCWVKHCLQTPTNFAAHSIQCINAMIYWQMLRLYMQHLYVLGLFLFMSMMAWPPFVKNSTKQKHPKDQLSLGGLSQPACQSKCKSKSCLIYFWTRWSVKRTGEDGKSNCHGETNVYQSNVCKYPNLIADLSLLLGSEEFAMLAVLGDHLEKRNDLILVGHTSGLAIGGPFINLEQCLSQFQLHDFPS